MKSKPLLIVFITVFVDLIGFGMIIPLSPFLAQRFGADAFQVGLLMAVYSGAQFIFSPMWGQISDRIGRRPVILFSLLGAGLAHLGFAMADTLLWLFAARTFAGLFGANISTAMAAIADVTDKSNRSKGMGIVGAAFGLGFVLGPALGGFLAQFSFEAPAYGAAAICLTNFVLAIFIFPETLKEKAVAKPKESRLARLKRHFKRPEVSPLLLATFLIGFSMANMEASLFLYVEDKFNWDLQTASFGFAYVGIMMAFTQGFLIRRILPKFGEMKLLVGGSLLFSVGMFIVGISSAIWILAIGMTALAIGIGIFNPSAQGLVSLRSSGAEQGEVMGVMQSLSALARIFGPPCGGYLYGQLGASSPFFLAAGFSGLVILLVRSQRKQRVTPSAVVQNKQELAELEIGLFQIENILRHQANVRFVDLQSDSEREQTKSHPNWSRVQWIFARSQTGTETQLLSEIGGHSDKAAPLVLISYSGEESLKLASQLDGMGFINVFAIAGGALGLLNEIEDN